jgi:hypothetical protein
MIFLPPFVFCGEPEGAGFTRAAHCERFRKPHLVHCTTFLQKINSFFIIYSVVAPPPSAAAPLPSAVAPPSPERPEVHECVVHHVAPAKDL